MSVVGCIAQDLIKTAASKALETGMRLLEGLFAGAQVAGPPPPKPAITVSHQIKHKSFLLALAGAVVGAALTIGITLLIGATTLGTGLVVGIVVGAAVGYGVSKLVDWIDSKLPADHGPVLPPCSQNVKIAGLHAARAGLDAVGCTRHSTPPLIAEGSATVRINGAPLARVDDKTACGASLKQGVSTVLVGGAKDQVIEPGNEFLRWQRGLIVAIDFLPLGKGGSGFLKIFKYNGLKGGFKALWKSASRTFIGQAIKKIPQAIKNIRNAANYLVPPGSALRNINKVFKHNGALGGLGALSKSLSRAFARATQAAANALKHLTIGQFRKFGSGLRSIIAGMCKSNKPKNPSRTISPSTAFNGGINAKDPKCAVGCPVDTATGAVVETRRDFTLGRTLQFAFTRDYDSRRELAGLFGRGWMDTASEHLRVSHEGEHLEFYCVSGEVVPFDIAPGTLRVFNPRFPHYTLIRHSRGVSVHNLRDDLTREFELLGARGRLVRLSDAFGNSIDFSYTGDKLATIQHSDGLTIAIHRAQDPTTERESIIIERVGPGRPQQLARYTLDAGLLVAAQTVHGDLSYRYNDHGRLERWSDSAQTWATYEYDPLGRCVRSRAARGVYSVDLEYDEVTASTRVHDSSGRTTTFTFDSHHQLIARADPLGHTETYAYNRHGWLLREIDAIGGTTVHEYEPVSGLRIRTIDPNGHTTEYEYDEHLRPVAVIDAEDQVWSYHRDERGAIAAISAPDDSVHFYTYNSRGQTTAITRPDGLSRALTYDAHSRLVEETDWRGQTHRYTYDHQDRLIEARDAQGRADAFFYDPRDRLTALRHADGHQIRYAYDSEHNLTALTDENGHTTRAEYGAFDLHLATIDPEGRRYDFSYDPDHLLLTEVRAPDGRRYRLQRDAAGRVTHETDYHGATTHYQHDAAGRLIERRGAARQHLRYCYDRRGAVLAVEADGESTTFAYDQLGRLIRAANATTTLEWTYDALGRVTRAAQDGDVLEYIYDSSGRCVERTLRPGIWQKTAHTTHFTHDPAGQLTHLHLPCEQTLQIERDDLGRPTRLSTERGLQLDQEFDLRGALTRQHLTPSASSRAAPLRRTYTYDPANNPRALDDARWGATHFSYDKSDRVIAAERPGPAAEHFRYGPAGQLAAADHPGAPVPFTFAPDGRLHRAGDTEHTYDDAGRLIARTVLRRGFRPARWTFTWDSHDRLIVAGTPDGHTWRYTYDPLGRRIRKFCPNTREAVLYLWDGDVLLREIHLQPRGPTHDQQVVMIVHWHHEPGTFHPLAREQDGEAHFVITDHLGTPRELVDPSGQITWRARHTTWGALHPDPESDPTTCPIRFQGQYEDPETGLHYNRFRYYDPNTATYLTPDPLGLAGGLQPTAYVHNPNAWIDPLGLAGCSTGTSRSARRETMRQEGIPTSHQPLSQSKNASGHEYLYKVPSPGGGSQLKSVQQQTMDRSHLDQPHWEAGRVKTDPLTGDVIYTKYGRPKLNNGKSKVDY